MLNCIQPSWDAPASVRAYMTTRYEGESTAPYHGFNVAHHVGDQAEAVEKNRQILMTQLQLPSAPRWLNQVHGVRVVDDHTFQPNIEADACYSEQKGQVCAVMTADCLPILICNQAGTAVAAVHAGWRSLVAGVIENTISKFPDPPEELLVWFGAAISQAAFEVGQDVYEAFTQLNSDAAQAFFPSSTQQGKWQADLYLLARQRLQNCGVSAIYGGEYCTYHEADRFYSYRREAITGRMVSLIFIQES